LDYRGLAPRRVKRAWGSGVAGTEPTSANHGLTLEGALGMVPSGNLT